jgi:1-hydroxy-2-naphthoate dioxygenase
MAALPPTQAAYTDEDLERFHAQLARANMRGQWQNEAVRKTGQTGLWDSGSFLPKSGGEGHLWSWDTVQRFLDESCDAVPESYTSRRSIMFNNPGLAKGTTNTINMGIQMIRPGELAWAHRHSISAVRFVISGDPGISTVVDGVRCAMETGDLILTPQWMWHDHLNQTDENAIWLDVLDGPVLGMFNQVIFESYGEKQQPVRNIAGDSDGSPMTLRYPWRDAEAALMRLADQAPDPREGFVHDYLDPKTGAAPLPTIGCRMHRLPPGFSGESHRRSISAVYHVVRGEGTTVIGDKTLSWKQGDCFVVPNWSWRGFENSSASADAVLFSVHDTPLLERLGLYREDLAMRIGANGSARGSTNR